MLALRRQVTSLRVHSGTLLALLFVALNVAVLWVFIHGRLPSFPIGWDAPYYISRARFFLEQGVVSNRMGYIGLLAGLHSLLGVSLVHLQVIAMVGITTLLALASALLVHREGRTGNARFALVFLFVFWAQTFFALTITTFDNAFALSFAILALALLARPGSPTGGTVGGFGVCAALVALTHIETFAFLVAASLVFLILRTFRTRSLKRVLSQYRGFLIIAVPAVLLLIIQWGSALLGIALRYLQRADVSGNASIPYAQVGSFADVWQFLRTGIGGPVVATLFLLGVAATVAVYVRNRDRTDTCALLAYGFVAYGVLLYSVLGGSIPINRTTLLVPVPLFLAIGLSDGIRWLFPRLPSIAWAASGLSVLIATVTIPPYSRYVARFPVAIGSVQYAAMQELGAYVQRNRISQFVVVGDIRSDDRAAGAYLGLWDFWFQSVLPLPRADERYCLYLGTLVNYRQRKATSRLNNPEYLPTSESSLLCLTALQSDPPTFLLDGFAPVDYPNAAVASIGFTRVAPHVLRVD